MQNYMLRRRRKHSDNADGSGKRIATASESWGRKKNDQMSPLLLSLLPHLHLHLNAEKGGEREGSLGYLTLCKLIFLLVLVIRKTYANFSLHDTKEVVTVFSQNGIG